MRTSDSTPATNHNGRMPAPAARALTLIAAALGLGIVFDILLYGKLPGISFPLCILSLFVVLGGLAYWRKVPLSRTSVACMVLALFFASMVAVRASSLLTFLNITTTLYLLLLVAYTTFRPQLARYRIADYLAMPLYAVARLGERWSDVWSDAVLVRGHMGQHQTLKQVVRGVLIAAPILVIFGALFASADLVFRKYLTDLVHIDMSFEGVMRLFWIVVIGAIVLVWLAQMLGVGAALRPPVETKFAPANTKGRRKLSSLELMIVFGSLNVLFLCFLAVQFRYLFGGEQNIMAQGFTYAEYARKGFFELIAVAVVAMGVLLVAEKYLAGAAEKQRMYFKVLAAVLIAQVLVVMLSAFQRLVLYEDAYGFTVLRLYSHLAIVWLAMVLVLVGYKIVRDKPEQLVAFGAFVSVLVFVLVVNVLNVDGFVARKNIERYAETGKIDMFYITTLSADAVPQVARLKDDPDQRVRVLTDSYLFSMGKRLEFKGQHWQSANLSRHAAAKAIDDAHIAPVRKPIDDHRFYESPPSYENR